MAGADAGERGVRRRQVRSAARVVQVGDQVAFVVFDLWRTGAITVPVPSAVLQRSLGLARGQLGGARATAVINADALLDHEVQPRAWRPTSPASSEQEPSDGIPAALPGWPTGAPGVSPTRQAPIPAPRTRRSRP